MSGDGNQYGDTTVAGFAKAIIGNVYNNHYHEVKESHSEEDWKLLLTSLCYQSMNDRKDQIHSAHDSTCEWIWSTIFARWLRVKNAKIFWISGKPGSGKSTLIKYLSRSDLVKQKLPGGHHSWVVIDFFFDFRLAERTGNTVEGLLRSLLSQIILSLPRVGEKLRAGTYKNPTNNSLEYLQEEFQTAIDLAQCDFLILVDGLDEYSGKVTLLLQFLFRLKGLQRVKLCLASRPEPMIQQFLDNIPSIAMSYYNSTGINHYIDAVIHRFQPQLDILSQPEIKTLILYRSDGVFLWTHLVLDALVEACAEGATLVDLKELLNILPVELESLYDRILEKVPASRKPEAAVIFTLINTGSAHVTLSLLQHTLYFLAHEMQISSLPQDLTDDRLFERRLHGTMRGLVDLVRGPDERFPETNQKSYTVRLIHRTLRSYAENSSWFQDNLLSSLQHIDPSWLWAHICSKTILNAGIYTPKYFQRIPNNQHHTRVEYNIFAEVIMRLSKRETIVYWTALLFHSIAYIVMHAELAVRSGSRAIQALTRTALRSPISSIHHGMIGKHWERGLRPLIEVMDCEYADLILAGSHYAFCYISSQMARIVSLVDDQRAELVSVIMLTLNQRLNCPGECSRIDMQPAQEIIDSILSLDQRFSPFHLGVYLRLGYAEIPRFLQRPLERGEQCPVVIPKMPSSFIMVNLFPKEPPLFIWACEIATRSREKARPQLEVLASSGVNIHSTSSTGHNIIHYIITRHIIGHTFLEPDNDYRCFPRDDVAEAIEKLYLVEEAGADFTVQFEHRTPLQAFRYGVDVLRKTENLGYDIPEARFVNLDFILEHKELVGHLPQPMLGASY